MRGLRILVTGADAPLGKRLVNEALLRGHTVVATVADPEVRFSPTVRTRTAGDGEGFDVEVAATGQAAGGAERTIVVDGPPEEDVVVVLPTVEPGPGSRTGRYGRAREGVLTLEDLAVAVLDEVDRPSGEDVLAVGPA